MSSPPALGEPGSQGGGMGLPPLADTAQRAIAGLGDSAASGGGGDGLPASAHTLAQPPAAAAGGRRGRRLIPISSSDQNQDPRQSALQKGLRPLPSKPPAGPLSASPPDTDRPGMSHGGPVRQIRTAGPLASSSLGAERAVATMGNSLARTEQSQLLPAAEGGAAKVTSSPFKSPFKKAAGGGAAAQLSPGRANRSPVRNLASAWGGGSGPVAGGDLLGGFAEPEPETDSSTSVVSSAPAPPFGISVPWATGTPVSTGKGQRSVGSGGPKAFGNSAAPLGSVRQSGGSDPLAASQEPGRVHKEKAGKLTVFPMNFSGAQPPVPPPGDDDQVAFTSCIVRRPCLSLMIMLVVPLIMSVVALIKAPLELDITAESFEIRASHFSQQRQRSMLEAVEIEGEHYTMRRRQLWTPPEHRLARIQLIYVPEEIATGEVPPLSGDFQFEEMLDKPRLERVRDIEQVFRRFEDFDKWCKRDPQLFQACTPPSSLITYVYPRVNSATCKVSYDGLGEDMIRPLSTVLESLSHVEDNDWFFPLGHTGTSSKLLRTEFDFALDHKPTDDEVREFRRWLRRIRKPLFALQGNGVDIYIGGTVLTEILVLDELYHDMTLACTSMLLVLVYTSIHTGSLLLAVMAMLMIALSFPVSLFVYYVLFGNAEVGVLNVLSVYIVLGIGVD
eukprot:SAG22_NODE_2619_length_2369_cov_38.584684_1_plen_671_part_10